MVRSRWVLPDPREAEPGEDLVGVGADLDIPTLLDAYSRGLFPMNVGADNRLLGWWSPDPRGVLPLDRLRVTRSLRMSSRRFTVTSDTCFSDVMAGCADPRRPSGWITEEFEGAYARLHRAGFAHSVEVWDREGGLVGGLYGVAIGGLFAGESMFHRARDASKVALMALVDLLGGASGAAEGRILDVQWVSDHLASLGAIELPRGDYLDLLPAAIALEPRWDTDALAR